MSASYSRSIVDYICTQAQLWLIVTNLCMDAAAQQRYHMHSYRKNQARGQRFV
jgi:hypothetical protein